MAHMYQLGRLVLIMDLAADPIVLDQGILPGSNSHNVALWAQNSKTQAQVREDIRSGGSHHVSKLALTPVYQYSP